MEPVSLTDLLTATSGEAIGFRGNDVSFSGVGIDSRKVRPGDLFWALSGERHDGHSYLEQAFASGAVAAVIHEEIPAGVAGPVIRVEDTLQALWDFAAWHRHRCEAMVIGVTGSVGKTTTRNMIHAVLSTSFQGRHSPRNYNNHIGVPLSLLEISLSDEFAVLELAASHSGEIAALAAVAAPEIGVVTGIGPSHLEGFGDLQTIIREKGELLAALPESGFGIINGDELWQDELADRARCPVIRVGESEQNDLQATDIRTGQQPVSFQLGQRTYEVPAVGRHHVQAALCAIAIAREVGLDDNQIAAGLHSFRAAPGRCDVRTIGSWTVIDDTYNASPLSVRAACEILENWDRPGRRILVLGDMLELGQQSKSLHREIGGAVAAAGIDHLLVHGHEATEVVAGARAAGMDVWRLGECEDYDALLTVLDCWLEPGDVVLVKGSRGMHMERVIDWMQTRADQEQIYQFAASQPQRAVA